MKSMFGRMLSLLAAAIFVAFIAVFVFNLRQGQNSATGNMEGQSGYPSPESAAAQPESYPAPDTTSNQSGNTQPLTWLTYNGEAEIGFSFQYRSDFLISADKNANQAFGEVRMVFPRVGASTISILENPGQLSLEAFLESEEFVNNTNFVWPQQGISAYAEPLTIGGQPSLGFQSHRDLVGLFGAAGYVIFVPLDGQVVQATIDGGGPIPDSGSQPYKASDEAISLTIQVLNSLQISTFPE